MGIPREGRTAKVHTTKVRTAKVRTAKVRTAKVRTAKVRTAKVRTAKVRITKVRTAKVRTAKVRTAKVRSAKVRVAKVRAAKVRTHDCFSNRLALADHGTGLVIFDFHAHGPTFYSRDSPRDSSLVESRRFGLISWSHSGINSIFALHQAKKAPKHDANGDFDFVTMAGRR